MKRLIQLAVLAAIPLQAQTPLPDRPLHPVHSFHDKTNLALFSADFLTRTLDAQSTERFLHAPCNCWQENQIPAIAASPTHMYLYSVGVVGANVGIAYLMHKKGHHKIERMVPAMDVVLDGHYVVSNYRLNPQGNK